jgi:hypothetical protein
MPDDRERWLRAVAASHPVSGFLGVTDRVQGAVAETLSSN